MSTKPVRWLLAAGVLGAAVLGACGDATSGPSQFFLLGQWGSSAVSLVAIRAGAEVQLPCAAVIIDDPIELTGNGAFSAIGRLQTSSALLGTLPKIRVSGRANGSHVSLTVPDQAARSPMTYQLDAGVVPAPTEVPECPL